MGTDTPKINLKTIRAAAGLSLTQTADLTGVSKAMLGQIERGESSPTLVTLWKLAKGFHLPLTAFIEDMTPVTEAPRTLQFDDSLRVQTLFPYDPAFGSESFLITLEPGQTHVSHPHDAGVVEDIFVTTGEMEVQLGGTWTRYRAGDAVRFNADQPHSYRNLSDSQTLFHNTLHYSRAIPAPGAKDR